MDHGKGFMPGWMGCRELFGGNAAGTFNMRKRRERSGGDGEP